ncbi:Glutamate receptor ionotropic, delta-1 [Nymphon striatum]|nr:Glutamate receptor ionotropic, delta-1 [Nymphon striatum]
MSYTHIVVLLCTALKVFDLHIVHDLNYGVKLKNGSWNGMIGELIDKKADIALGPLSVTTEREKVVDFSPVILHSGMSLVYKNPKVRTFNIQSMHFEPSKSAIRGVLWILWIWCIIINVAYTANIFSVLAMNRKSVPFKSLYEFSNQDEYKPLILKNSAGIAFFKNSSVQWHKRIWKKLLEHEHESFVNTLAEGGKKIMEKKVAFICDYLFILMNLDEPDIGYLKDIQTKDSIHLAFRKKFRHLLDIPKFLSVINKKLLSQMSFENQQKWRRSFPGCLGTIIYKQE